MTERTGTVLVAAAGVKLTETIIPPSGSIATFTVYQHHITFMEIWALASSSCPFLGIS